MYEGENEFKEEIYLLETTDPVLGGPDGIANRATKELADRTVYLKENEVGMVAAFAMQTPPDGWILANGARLLRSEYELLFDQIGTFFANTITEIDLVGNAITTNVPHGFSTGDAIQFFNRTPGSSVEILIDGSEISEGQIVYARNEDPAFITFYETQAQSIAGGTTGRGEITGFDIADTYLQIEKTDSFRVPDARGFVRGFGASDAYADMVSGPDVFGKITDDNPIDHTHATGTTAVQSGTGTTVLTAVGAATKAEDFVANMPPNIALMNCIKYK